jgi:predicted nucleic acid-binding protein
VKACVIDANIAAKWVLPPAGEAFVEHALQLLDRHGKGDLQFVVPDLFWAETGNILRKAVRYGRCSKTSAEKSLATLKASRLVTVPTEGLVEAALTIAVTFHRTVYDSLYVALAQESGTVLITADERLANAIAGRCPVKWLGAV